MPLVGTWRLLRYEVRLPDGRRLEPFGPEPVGCLSYDDGGRMAAQLMRRNRAPFASDEPLSATPDEARGAFRCYLAYAGTYVVNEAEAWVAHRVEIAWFPNWVGTEQRRFYELDGDRLTLRTPPLGSRTAERVGVLTWERAR